MQPIPYPLVRQYVSFMDRMGVPRNVRQHYQKWLGFYLDFCRKYGLGEEDKGSLPPFVENLKQKNQGECQRKQAVHAVSLFVEMRLASREPVPSNFPKDNGKIVSQSLHSTPSAQEPERTFFRGKEIVGPVGQLPVVSSDLHSPRLGGADWTAVFRDLRSAIQMRHYSPATLRTYGGWTRKFQAHAKSKDPSLVAADDVKAFLSWLAVEKNVSASSQNQAFNTLLFLFRNLLAKDFGKVDGVGGPRQVSV